MMKLRIVVAAKGIGTRKLDEASHVCCVRWGLNNKTHEASQGCGSRGKRGGKKNNTNHMKLRMVVAADGGTKKTNRSHEVGMVVAAEGANKSHEASHGCGGHGEGGRGRRNKHIT